MTITVANIRTTRDGVYVGRAMPRQRLAGSPLGNPYSLKKYSRDEALSLYREWLDGELAIHTSPAFREIERLVSLHAQHGRLTLLCWCAPEACHADIIKETIERLIAA